NWRFETIDTGIIIANLIFSSPKICIDNRGRPHVAYLKRIERETDTIAKIQYGYKNGNLWQILVIDSFLPRSIYINVEDHVDLTLSPNGIPHISYWYINRQDTSAELRYAYKSGDSWRILPILSQRNVIWEMWLNNTSIVLNDSLYPVILFSYYTPNFDTSYLFLAIFNGLGWKIDTVIKEYHTAFIPFGLKFADNKFHVLFQEEWAVFYAVKINENWLVEWTRRRNGMGEAYGDLELDGSKPCGVFSSISGPLTYIWKYDTIWEAEVITGGLFPSLAIDPYGKKHISCLTSTEPPGMMNSICYIYEGIPEIRESNNQLSYFPYASLNTLNTKEIRVYDVSGKLILKDRISLRKMKKGVYIAKVSKQRKIIKIIKF
ncbi:MAG: hypothetical protein ABIK90_06925, partial [candidate division WOR-3 bacterium]